MNRKSYLTLLSPLNKTVRRDQKFEIQSLVGEEGLCENFSYRLKLASFERLSDDEFNQLIGKSLTVDIAYSDPNDKLKQRYINEIMMQITELGRISKKCSQFFQRSSSPFKGRNAQLSLRHHSMHRLSDSNLSMLTAIHNLYIKRPDGTTTAERLFESKPKDMFECLLNNIDFPARPRRKHLKLAG